MALPASVRFNSWLFALSLLSIIGILNLFSYSRLPQIDESHQQTTMVQPLTGRTPLGRGMVMCVGNDASLIAGALYIIQDLRDTWKSLLPVAVNHCNELSIQTQSLFTKFQNVSVENMCDNNTPKTERKRLKGWFCKTKALISSKFEETLVVDTDVLWFKDPTQLFNAPGYLATGALFFRDRFLYVSTNEKDGLETEKVTRFIESESKQVVKIDNAGAKVLSESNGINFFWRHAANSSHSKAIRHVQESSVIVFNAIRLPKTIQVMSRLLQNFRLGKFLIPFLAQFLSPLSMLLC
jgi:Mannosyltransferase putative